MEQIPVELIVSEESVRAGLAAMERIHGRHLGNMNPEEQETAREHWRAQVEEILMQVRNGFEDPPAVLGAGRAVISFSDAGGDEGAARERNATTRPISARTPPATASFDQ